MAKNSKPILSVLIDEDKRTKFADLARRHSLSMGYLVNKAVDRMLELDSIDIYGESTRSPQPPNINMSSIDITDVENLINTSIANLDLKSIIAAQLPPTETPPDIEQIVKEQVEPLADLITELEAYTRSQIDTLRNDLKKQPAIAR
jgi:hypothetical protein